MMFQERTKLKNAGFVRQAVKMQPGEAPHGLDFVQDISHLPMAG